MHNLLGKILFYSSVLFNSNSKTFIQIIEHQKSGGTWLARILSDYFDIPFFKHLQWIGKRGIVRLHSKYQYAFKSSKQIYVLRDGRDVLTSYYFHFIHRNKIPQAEKFENTANAKANMSKFLDMYFNKKLNNKILWQIHTSYWMSKVKSVLRYEDLTNSTYKNASVIIQKFSTLPIDKMRLLHAISENDFQKLSGRNQGQEDQSSFFRKGIIGDWKNYFNFESAQIFNYYAGKQLINLGYEKDDSWVYGCKK